MGLLDVAALNPSYGLGVERLEIGATETPREAEPSKRPAERRVLVDLTLPRSPPRFGVELVKDGVGSRFVLAELHRLTVVGDGKRRKVGANLSARPEPLKRHDKAVQVSSVEKEGPVVRVDYPADEEVCGAFVMHNLREFIGGQKPYAVAGRTTTRNKA